MLWRGDARMGRRCTREEWTGYYHDPGLYGPAVLHAQFIGHRYAWHAREYFVVALLETDARSVCPREQFSTRLTIKQPGSTNFSRIRAYLKGFVNSSGKTAMGEGFFIRKAAHADANGILECLGQAFEAYRGSYTPAGFSDTILTPETLQSRFTKMTVLVAVDESGRVIGTVAYKTERNREGHIRGMAVRPERHGCGAAKKLLDQVEADLRDLHCRAITLDTTRPLQRAIHFYEKNGFRATGEIGSFFGMDLFAYRKEL